MTFTQRELPSASVGLEAFARAVVEIVPWRNVLLLLGRLRELEDEARADAADRRRSADARHEAEIRARTYARAARALEQAHAEEIG